MDRDEEQIFRHSVRTLVSTADILRGELQRRPFSEEVADEMLLIYWKYLISSSFAPDIGDLMKKLMPRSDD